MPESVQPETLVSHLLSAARVGSVLLLPFPLAVFAGSQLFGFSSALSAFALAGIQVAALALLVVALRFDDGSGISLPRVIVCVAVVFALYLGAIAVNAAA